MAGTVKEARLDTRTARNRLKRGRQAHWQPIVRGKCHLGWQCWPGEAGRWLLRYYVGDHAYRRVALGQADDSQPANGSTVLNYDQAAAMARAQAAVPQATNPKLTVREAMANYIDHLNHQGKARSAKDVAGAAACHIYPSLGDRIVTELTAKELRQWLAAIAAMPAQLRPNKHGEPNYKPRPTTSEAKRARQASANRVLTMLRAALNHAYDEDHVSNNDAWGRKLKMFHKVATARLDYLNIAEAQRLLNAAAPDFRPLARAALETGCRYGELTQLQVQDFNADAGTVHVRMSKSGKSRHVVLTDEGADFFRAHCAGRARGEVMFKRGNGAPWLRSQQQERMLAACKHARLTPVGFHQLRHTWASLAVMNGMPLMVVAKNLGHRDTRMVEHHYGHLAPSFIVDAIRTSAPRYGIAGDAGVVALQPRGR